MSHHIVLRVISKIFIPMILLFALYVQFHGDFGPGGGFQAGVIFAAAFVLHTLIFGAKATALAIPSPLARALMAVGLLLYLGTGFAALVRGGNFLDYNVLASAPIVGQHYGILLVELGVGVTVAAVMITVFFAFTGRR